MRLVLLLLILTSCGGRPRPSGSPPTVEEACQQAVHDPCAQAERSSCYFSSCPWERYCEDRCPDGIVCGYGQADGCTPVDAACAGCLATNCGPTCIGDCAACLRVAADTCADQRACCVERKEGDPMAELAGC